MTSVIPCFLAVISRGCFVLLLIVSVLCPSCTVSAKESSTQTQVQVQKRRLVIGVDGGTESIRACCFDAIDGRVVGESCASSYPTHHPQPGWAEQDPLDWYEKLGASVRGAIQSLTKGNQEEGDDYEICAICMDTTCCSVVFLDDAKGPIRPSLLWMDARSAPQTQEIMTKCRGDPALKVNSGGEGPLSAEWMTPKSLWVFQNEPHVWAQASTICEYQDYLNYKLTGRMVASSCNAASRWHWNGDECILNSDNSEDGDDNTKFPGRPLSMYQTLGIPELAHKLPRRCLPMGSRVGEITREAALHLQLPEGLPVIQGGADAFVGMIGLGCIHPGQLCLITGSSHLHCVVTSKPSTAPGTWGAYRGAPLAGMTFAEAGQSSTGSIVRWAKHALFDQSGTALTYKDLDTEAATIPPGSDGLVALETFQGSRTPITDPLARGALLGLTLSHTRAHIWRALMEGVCFGTKGCIEGLAKAGHVSDEIIVAGGATRSPLWLQMHADVTGLPVVVCENGDAPLLGCAILASVGVGIHKDVEGAVNAMVRQARRVDPDKDVASQYAKLYKNVYSKVGEAARPIAHAMFNMRGGGEESVREKSNVIISPSILAADWADVKGELSRCIKAGTTQIHMDIFDGVFIDSPLALTFGPKMVQDIRRSFITEKLALDLHMCVDRPERYVVTMAEAGADRFIFQWEAMVDHERAVQLAEEVQASGMRCGISLNPATDLQAVYPLLETGLIDLVDILAVEPGFGGQKFQEKALKKIEALKKWRLEAGVDFAILVDGGINHDTAPAAIEAGADILVAGTFLFKHPMGLSTGVDELLQTSSALLTRKL